MVKRAKTTYVCQQCGVATPGWSGRCPACSAWNSLVETVERASRSDNRWLPSEPTAPIPMSRVTSDGHRRVELPLREFSRVLGGGIVPGSLVLVGGDPGIGKSTLLLQAMCMLAQQGGPVLYVSGEESPEQLRLRADRIGGVSDALYVLPETNLQSILEQAERLRPTALVVDSIQTVYLEELDSAAGSVGQLRECALRLMRFAKKSGTPVFLVGHVTKEGAIAGPRVLEHIVDAVLYLEGERFHSYRLLRSVKNRFGSTNEVGVFEMAEGGMLEVPNPSEVFLAERSELSTGSAVAVTVEGTRALLVEVQALTTTTSFGLPRRTANGIELSRLLLLTAVLTKRVGLALSNQDIYVNVVGGLKITEPAADLSIAAAITSSFRDVAVPHEMALIGEIGLSGELRSVSQIDKRLTEAAKLGFRRCLIPKTAGGRRLTSEGLELVTAGTLRDALERISAL
ncbi:MAG: DNA repair protein RadA [Chloroflexi bacterium]|nr:DNA repair protein RadA [Chloroflexota bacterium]